ncbi:MAG: transcription antitermination factor NusB [Syntrophorhabdales bacterium]
MRRRKARELALKILYQVEVNLGAVDAALDRYLNIFPYQDEIVDYTRFLLSGVKKEQPTLDFYIEEASENWKISRITYVDKNILRVAIFEMLYSPEVPPKVAIDEAIELAKKFGGEDSKNFVNGVLDRILKDHYGKGAGGADEEQGLA